MLIAAIRKLMNFLKMLFSCNYYFYYLLSYPQAIYKKPKEFFLILISYQNNLSRKVEITNLILFEQNNILLTLFLFNYLFTCSTHVALLQYSEQSFRKKKIKITLCWNAKLILSNAGIEIKIVKSTFAFC